MWLQAQGRKLPRQLSWKPLHPGGGPISPHDMAPSSGGWSFHYNRMQLRMHRALEERFCLSGRQNPQQSRTTLVPSTLWPECVSLVAVILRSRDKRIADRAAARRWLWPSCSMGWEENFEYGLPSEAMFLASGASLGSAKPSEGSRHGVGERDCPERLEVKFGSQEVGADCGKSQAAYPRITEIPEHEMLLAMAGDGGDDGWSRPSWDMSLEPEQVHFEPEHRTSPHAAAEGSPTSRGLGPDPSRQGVPEFFAYHDDQTVTAHCARPAPSLVSGCSPLPSKCPGNQVVLPSPQVAQLPWPPWVVGPDPDLLPCSRLAAHGARPDLPCP